MKIVVKYITFI